MRSKDIQLGKVYAVKVSGSIAPVRLTGENRYGGYDGRNLKTNREIRIRTAVRLRYEMVEAGGKWVPKIFSRPVVIAGNRLTEHTTNVAMNDINDGGPDNPAQFSNDNA